MSTKVKICGLTTKADIDVALEHGVDYVGLVFFEPSPRNLSISDGRHLARYVAGRAKVVALTVDAPDTLIKLIASEIRPDICQLHGNEDLARVSQVAALTGAEIMKVIKVTTSQDAERALACKHADYILFDAKAPEDFPLPGGNGLKFDWRALETVRPHINFMLSGGLTPDNVQEAIKRTGACAVDVSSGVESAPGRKDPVRIRAFLQAAKEP
ncbi:MAG: phosphoribosylanthranilate isomerase [Pseudomonadota bacterium]